MRHLQNGPSLSKAPAKKLKAMTDEELAARLNRKDAAMAETIRIEAKTRKFNQVLRNDPVAALRELGLLKND